MAHTTIIFRSRPVRLETIADGWRVSAIERGYFPISAAGFFNFTHFTPRTYDETPATHPQPTSEQMEALAAAYDAQTRKAIEDARAAVTLRLEWPKRFDSFHRLRHAAAEALRLGFFARPEDRAQLWHLADLILERIASDPFAQPTPGQSRRWPAESSAHYFAESQKARAALRNLLKGNFQSSPDLLNAFSSWTAPAYFQLSEVPESIPAVPEAVIELAMPAAQPAPEDMNPDPEAFAEPAQESDSSGAWENAQPVAPKRGQLSLL